MAKIEGPSQITSSFFLRAVYLFCLDFLIVFKALCPMVLDNSQAASSNTALLAVKNRIYNWNISIIDLFCFMYMVQLLKE